MNKLKLVRGVEDAFEHFNFFQDGIADTFKNWLAGFGIAADESFRISGCEVTVSVDTPAVGQTTYHVTAGTISLEGEILPVDEHSVIQEAGQTTYWTVVETFSDITPAEVFGGGQVNVQAVRKGKLVASNTVPSVLMKPKARRLEWKIMDAAHPIGMPVWYDPRLEDKVLSDKFNLATGEGKANDLYEGWILLGVYPGTEDYLGKALVGINPNDTDIDHPTASVGDVGGEKKHLLAVGELPKHTHPLKRVETTSGVGNYPDNDTMGDSSPANTDGTTGEAGNNEAHNNMQPYIVAALIARKSDAAYYV